MTDAPQSSEATGDDGEGEGDGDGDGEVNK